MGSVRLTVAALVALAISCSDDISKPQCQSDGDCTGSAGTCETFSCQDDSCKVVPAAAGTPVPGETAAVCHAVQCNGSGGTTTVVDDTNTPSTNTPCAVGICTSGVPSSVLVEQGTACGQGLVCDGTGKCIGCIAASECPGSNSQCQTVECNGGTCGFNFTAQGTALSSQTQGDCEAVVCNGSGGTETVVNDNNLPTTANQCLQAVCTDGVPSNPPQPEGSACGSGSATFCDGSGDCVNCVLPTDCPGSDTQCQTRTCSAGVCGFDFTASGTPLTNQTPGDCLQAQCDGSGGVQEAIDNANTPASTACATGTCTSGSAGFSDLPPGTGCGSGTSECDGSGNCVGCLTGSDCPGQTTDCEQPACAMNVCGTTFTAAGTPTTTQTAGDCQENECDGAGNIIQVIDDTNTPSNTDCADGTCTNGSAGFSNLPQDTVCETTDECDGSGNCVSCGDGTIQGAEVCNGTDLDGATCTSLGDASGTLACGSDCFEFDTSGCTGGWVSGSGTASPFTGGVVAVDGMHYEGTNAIVAVATTEDGIWRGTVSDTADVPDPVWANADGTGSTSVTSLTGRGVKTLLINSKITFWTTNASEPDLFSGNNFAGSVWGTGSGNQPSFPEMINDIIPGSSDTGFLVGWDPASGEAFAFHGNTINVTCGSNFTTGCEWEVFGLNNGVTGAATGITTGNTNPTNTTFDVHVAVNGLTGSGGQGSGAGIYWTCDGGTSYVEDDTGISDTDKQLLWKVYADTSTFSNAQPARTCPTSMASITQYASTMYAALLGGSSVYKTTNGGATWFVANTGLPTGVQVNALSEDCEDECLNPQVIYAATNLGVYRSLDGANTWTLDGLQGQVVNAIATENVHPSSPIAASPGGIVENGNVATITLTTSNFNVGVGDTIVITGVGTGYNGQATVTSVTSQTSFTATLATTGLAASGGGSVNKFLPRVFAATNQPNGMFQNNLPTDP